MAGVGARRRAGGLGKERPVADQWVQAVRAWVELTGSDLVHGSAPLMNKIL
jgi:hypothetical protein